MISLGSSENMCRLGLDIFLLLRSNPSRQHVKVLYHWGARRKGKTGNHGKVGVETKWWVLAHPPYSPKEMGGSHLVWNHLTSGIDHLTRRRTQGACIVKDWEDKRDRWHIPDTFV